MSLKVLKNQRKNDNVICERLLWFTTVLHVDHHFFDEHNKENKQMNLYLCRFSATTIFTTHSHLTEISSVSSQLNRTILGFP